MNWKSKYNKVSALVIVLLSSLLAVVPAFT